MTTQNIQNSQSFCFRSVSMRGLYFFFKEKNNDFVQIFKQIVK